MKLKAADFDVLLKVLGMMRRRLQDPAPLTSEERQAFCSFLNDYEMIIVFLKGVHYDATKHT